MGNIKIGKFVDDETGEALNDTERVLNKLGIRLRADNNTFRDTDEVLQDIADRWDEFTDVERNSIAVAIGGTRQRENFIVLMENFGKAMEYTKTATNSAGTSFKKMKAYTESLEGSVETLKASFQELVTSIANSQQLIDIVKALTDVVNKLNSQDWEMAKQIGEVVVKVGAGIAILVKLFNIIKALATALAAVKAGATVAALAGLASAALPVIGIILGIVGAIAYMNGAFETSASKIKKYQKEIDELNQKEEEEIKLFKQYEELMTKSKAIGLTVEEKENLKLISEELVDVYGLEASGVDTLTGAYNINSKALENNIEKIREQKNALLVAQKEKRNTLINDLRNDTKKKQDDATNAPLNISDVEKKAILAAYEDIYKEIEEKTNQGEKVTMAKTSEIAKKHFEAHGLTDEGLADKVGFDAAGMVGKAHYEKEWNAFLQSLQGAEREEALRLFNDLLPVADYFTETSGEKEVSKTSKLSKELTEKIVEHAGKIVRGNNNEQDWKKFLTELDEANKDYNAKTSEMVQYIQQNITSVLGTDISASTEEFFNEVSDGYIASNATDEKSQQKLEKDLSQKLRDYNQVITLAMKEGNEISQKLLDEDVTLKNYKEYADNLNEKLSIISKIFGTESETFKKYQEQYATEIASSMGGQLALFSEDVKIQGGNLEYFDDLSTALLQLERKYKDGTISVDKYYQSLSENLEKTDFNKAFKENKKTASEFFNMLAVEGQQTLEYLAAQFRNNSISSEEYITSLANVTDYFQQIAMKAETYFGVDFGGTALSTTLDDIQTKMNNLTTALPLLSQSFKDFSNMSANNTKVLGNALSKLGIEVANINGKTVQGASNIVAEAKKSANGLNDLQKAVSAQGLNLLATFGSVAGGIITNIAKVVESFSITIPAFNWERFKGWLAGNEDIKISPQVNLASNYTADETSQMIDRYALAKSGLGEADVALGNRKNSNTNFTGGWTSEKQTEYNRLVKEAYADIAADPNNILKYVMADTLMEEVGGSSLFNPFDPNSTGNGGISAGTDTSDFEKYYAVIFQDYLSAILEDRKKAIEDFEEKNDELNDDLAHALEIRKVNNAQSIYSAIKENKKEYESALQEEIEYAEATIANTLIPAINELVPQFAISNADEMTNLRKQQIADFFETEKNKIEQDLHYLKQLKDGKLSAADKKTAQEAISDPEYLKNVDKSRILLEDRKNALEYTEEATNTNISTLDKFTDSLKENNDKLKESQRDISAYKALIDGVVDSEVERIELAIEKHKISGAEAVQEYARLYDWIQKVMSPENLEEAAYKVKVLDETLKTKAEAAKAYYEQIYSDAGTIKDYEVGLLEDEIDAITTKYDEQIEALEEKRQKQQETNDLIEAENRLRNLQKEKNKRVYREGLKRIALEQLYRSKDGDIRDRGKKSFYIKEDGGELIWKNKIK